MRTVSYRLGDLARATINIGKVAENEYTRVQFNAADILAEYPAATAALSVINPAGTAYPAAVTREGDLIIWDVTDADLTEAGQGELQLTLTENGVVIKSYIARTRIERSIVASGSTPDPVQNWLDDAEQALNTFPAGGSEGQVLTKKSGTDYDAEWRTPSGGGGGTSDYNDLDNKPQIAGTTLSGNKSLADLGIASAEAVSAKYTKPQTGIPADDIADGVIPVLTDLIDDTAGDGDTNKVWSADKSAEEVTSLSSAITTLEGEVEGISSDIGGYVSDWLDEHPEATTTVQDGSITEAKLASDVLDKLYGKTEMSVSATANGWRLNESDGLCSSNNSYKMVKYQVTAGDVVKVVSDDRFQFQSVASVPAYGTSNRVGDTTYGTGTFFLTVPSGATYLIVSTLATGSTANAYACEEITGYIEELEGQIKAEDAKIDDRTLYPSTNKYDPSKQTQDTISPHYYVNGVPYSTTQFDSSWNCTAPIPVKASTKYALGLVPAVNDSIVKPWADAASGWFAYDADGNYISGGSGNVFTTPANTATIRFNYYIALDTVSLSVLNQRCVLVEGEELPSNFIAYNEMTMKQKVETAGRNVNYVIHDDGEGVTLIAKYNALNDIAITLEKKGGNDLFDFYSFGLIGNTSKDISKTADSQTIFLSTGSDWFAPFVVKAINNIDGDSTSSDTFTGGNHQYNNTGTGSTATARGTALVFKADNMAVTSGSGSCSRFEMDWTNLVQATNTKKSDGTGREVLQENHRLIFDGDRFEFFVDLIPLEDVKMMVWYGVQWTWESGQNTPYPKVRYIGATDRDEHECDSAASASGDTSCCHVVGYGSNHEIRLDIDENYDLGDHKFYQTGTGAIFTATYGKGYCNFFNITDLAEDAMYSLHGWYQFKSRT